MSPNDKKIDPNYLIEQYIESCSHLTTSKIFAEWSLYGLISACLERRHWINIPGYSDKSNIYGNLYVLLVGPSGIGKTVAARAINAQLIDELARNETRRSGDSVVPTGKLIQPAINVAPTAITPEGLVQLMAEKFKKTDIILKKEDVLKQIQAPEYVGTMVLADEISVFFKETKHATNNMISFLTKGYDHDKFEDYTKGEGQKIIDRMCITFLGATTPEHLSRLFGSTSVKEGLGNRFIYIWCEDSDFFHVYHRMSEASVKFVKTFLKPWCNWLVNNYSPCEVGPGVEELATEIVLDKMKNPMNTDMEAASLYQRYNIHLQKMALVRHFMRSKEPIIEVEDILLAKESLEKIEPNIHKCFKEMFTSDTEQCAEDIKRLIESTPEKKMPAALIKMTLAGKYQPTKVTEVLDLMKENKMIFLNGVSYFMKKSL